MGQKIKRLSLGLKFTPDVPISSLGPDEFTDGLNVEYDVRGIRSVSGDSSVLTNLPSDQTPIFITGGFRANSAYFILVATTNGVQSGKWFMLDTSQPITSSSWVDITPIDSSGNNFITGYNQDTNITVTWNGTTVLVNDTIGAPFFMTESDTKFIQYTQIPNTFTVWNISRSSVGLNQAYVAVIGAKNTCSISGTTLTITTPGTNEFYVGMMLESSAAGFISGTTITGKTSSTSYTVSTSQTVTNAVITNNQWPSWIKSSDTNSIWARSIELVISGSLVGFDNYTWVVSQSSTYGQYSVGLSVKGGTSTTYVSPDTFVSGNVNCRLSPKYIWNYDPNWRSFTANFIRLYNSPNVGSILVAGGFKVVDSNGVVNKYPTTLSWSQAIGLNSVPLTWQPTITNVANQVEVPIQGELTDGYASGGNFYVSSYFDTAILSPLNYTSTSAPILSVRPFNPGRGMYSTNCWVQSDTRVFGIDARDIWEFSDGQFKSLGNQTTKNYLADKINSNFVNRIFMVHNSNKYQIEIYYPDDDSITGIPNKMLAYRYDLGQWNAPRQVSSATQATECPLLVKSFVPGELRFTPALSTKSVLYARGIPAVDTYTNTTQFAMKDFGGAFIPDNTNPNGEINSYFVKNGIPIVDSFNEKAFVYRVYPELSQIGTDYITNRNIQIAPTGSVDVYLLGSNAPGTPYNTISVTTHPINAEVVEPIIQYNPSEYRSHGIQISGSSNLTSSNIWYCGAITFQYTITKIES